MYSILLRTAYMHTPLNNKLIVGSILLPPFAFVDISHASMHNI